MRMQGFIRTNQGFSLTELLVALVVALVLIIGVASGYIVNKRSYEEETGIRDMQMNAHTAMDRIRALVMSAGLGCKDNFPPLGTDTLQGSFRSASRILSGSNSSNGPDTLTVVTGLRPLAQATAICSCQREEEDPCSYCEGSVVDIRDASVFDTGTRRYIFLGPSIENRFLLVTGIAGSQVTLSESIRWNDNDQVFRVAAYTITLDQAFDSTLIDVDGDGSTEDADAEREQELHNNQSIPDLYVYDNTEDLEEESNCKIAQGIEDLQFQYCTDCGDADNDGTIDEDQWTNNPSGIEDNVRAVRVFILARTVLPDPGYTEQTDSITIADHTIDLTSSPDPKAMHYHRYLLVETVLIRNSNL